MEFRLSVDPPPGNRVNNRVTRRRGGAESGGFYGRFDPFFLNTAFILRTMFFVLPVMGPKLINAFL
jgi:hypothetical protein